MKRFHPAAWLVWVAASTTVVMSASNPLTSLVAFAALAVVASTSSLPNAVRSWRFFFVLGLWLLLARVVLFGLTGHTGATTLVSIPRAQLPVWLGGFSLGGRITGEVVAQQAADGLKIAAFVACFGVFVCVVEVSRVTRLLPRFLFEAGLVVSIALAFVPAMLRRAGDVRDAQRLRGHRFRGIRSLQPLIVPVLADGLERSLTLAASMDVRGYGRAHQHASAKARAAAVIGLCGSCAGGALVLFGSTIVGMIVAILGAAALLFGVRALARSSTRTVIRSDKPDSWDRALIVCSALLAVAAILTSAHVWYAYPVLHAPPVDMPAVTLAVAITLPAVIDVMRARYMRRVSLPAVIEGGALVLERVPT